MEGECFHKTCFKCAHGGCMLTHSSYASLDGVLYCRHHFNQLFLEKGNYAHVLQSANHRRTASGNTLPPETTEEVAVEAKEENGDSQSWKQKYIFQWVCEWFEFNVLRQKIWFHLYLSCFHMIETLFNIFVFVIYIHNFTQQRKQNYRIQIKTIELIHKITYECEKTLLQNSL